MAYLGKEYKFVKEENFDKFLEAVGLPAEQIAKILAFRPVSKLVKNGDTYTYISITPEGTKETNFKSGVEISDSFQDKVQYTAIYTVDGNKITQVITTSLGTATFTREYSGDDLVVTVTSSKYDGVAKRYYKA